MAEEERRLQGKSYADSPLQGTSSRIENSRIEKENGVLGKITSRVLNDLEEF